MIGDEKTAVRVDDPLPFMYIDTTAIGSYLSKSSKSNREYDSTSLNGKTKQGSVSSIFEADQEEAGDESAEMSPEEHDVRAMLELENLQKYLMYNRLVKFKSRLDNRLAYVNISNSEQIDAIRDMIDILITFFPQFTIAQLKAILGELVMLLNQFNSDTDKAFKDNPTMALL